MKYVGIDLGTTNSAICSYDGESVRLYKSPDQNDVTPSAIFIDKRGNKYLGKRAYDSAAKNPDSAAIKFKRMMGTSTPVKLPAVNITMSPEECSAEIIKLCFGYLPEEIRNSDEIGTVITVPAAFNQMQKDATLMAAEMAGLGKVALMQEPVAAVMAVMRQKKGDGIFLVFDLGGGTLDIAIADSIGGSVNLLAHGGVAMCGGTDFDRAILDNVIKPWLMANFDLPKDLSVNQKYKSLLRGCLWAAENAKIELSAKEDAVISLPESDIGINDESDSEIYVDIPFSRQLLDELIENKLDEAIQSARDTVGKANLSLHDIERIVFVGGPTNYAPLRDRVCFELGIPAGKKSDGSPEVNPMTAVAEGAAVFAESIDWTSQSRGRKNTRGTISTGTVLVLSFDYTARTPKSTAKVVAKVGGDVMPGVEFQIDSSDTGTTTGRIQLKDGAIAELILSKPGENTFKVFVFDANGSPINLGEDKIVISRTLASIDAIPASHSLAIEARDKIGGRLVPVYLIRESDNLPKKGKVIFRTEESLKAGSPGSIKFKLWEGEISEPLHDNRFIGMFEIKGTDFDEGVISAGAELICEYEVLDSGNIKMEVSVPSIAGAFRNDRNFYSPQDGLHNYTDASKLVAQESEQTMQRLDEMSSKIDDPRLDQARKKLGNAESLKAGETDPEIAKQAMDDIQEAKRLLSLARTDHLPEIRQLDLDRATNFFDRNVREYARPLEINSYENLTKTAKNAIKNNSNDFESYLDELRQKNFDILWKQDWFVIDRFKWLAKDTYLFPDAAEHLALVTAGNDALKENNIDKLRNVVAHLDHARIGTVNEDEMMASANIIRG